MILTIHDDFDVNKIAGSGPCFRWEMLPTGGWRIPHGEHCLTVTSLGCGRYELDCIVMLGAYIGCTC